MSAPIDTAFLRFQATGSPEAIAAVFDLAATELLRVASHLTHDLHSAEDLVQATFVVAIERRAEYRPGAGVLPWLLGILTNRARRLRRDAARAPDPERVPSPAVSDPKDCAAAVELNESVDAALSGLPEVYRPVLRLHLRNHMNAREIALALERPPGTVRTQIVRGLELLRRALPVGVAGLLTAVRAPAIGLVAMRAEVIAHAVRVVPATVAVGGVGVFAVAGGLVMKKVIVAVAACVVVLSLGWVLTMRDSTRTSSVDQNNEALSRTVAMDPAESPSVPAAPERVVLPPWSNTRQEKRPSSAAHVRGRIVDEAGQPLARANVTLTRKYRTLEEQERITSLADLPEPDATSGADGRFDVALDPAGFLCVALIRLAGRVEMSSSTGELAPGADLDLGDIAIPAGCEVTGFITDADGVPVADALVSFERQNIGGLGPKRFSPEGYLKTGGADSHGHFALPEPLPIGTHKVTIHHPESSRWTPTDDLVITPGQRHVELRLTCERADAARLILGRLVDDRGAPIRGATIDCAAPGTGKSATAGTGRDGSFRLEGPADLPAEGLALHVDRRGYHTLRTPAEHRLGTGDVILVLHPLPVIDLTVVDRGTGTPVEGFGVRVMKDPMCYGGSSWEERILHRGTHDAGHLAVPASHSGRNLLVVEPSDERFARPRIEVVEVTDVDVPLRIELPARVSRTLRIVQADGSPVAGSRVELVEPIREFPIQREARVLGIDEFRRMSSSGRRPDDPRFAEYMRRNSEAMLVQSGTTDSKGEIVLTAGARDDFGLHLRGPGHVPVFIPRFALGEIDPICVAVDAGGRIEVAISPAEVVTALGAELRFVSVADESTALPPVDLFEMDGGLRIDSDGRVVVDGVPAGSWNAYLVFKTGSLVRADPIGSVEDVSAGAVRRLQADISHLRPGRLRGRVFVDGEPRPHARVYLGSTPPRDQAPVYVNGQRTGTGGWIAIRETDAEGSFEVELTPGTYRPSIALRPGVLVGVPHEITIAPGANLSEVLEVRDFRVVLHVRDATTGDPVSGRSFAIETALHFDLGGRWPTTDEAGQLVLDPAPMVPFELTTLPTSLASNEARMELIQRSGQESLERAKIRLGPFQVHAGEKEQVIEVQLPDR